MRRVTLAGGIALVISTLSLIAAPVAGATTYNNDAPIIINDDSTASPYPSSITVSGTADPINDVNVGFDGFTHGTPDDVAIVLVAPNGLALLLIGCPVETEDASGVFITLDDAAPTELPNSGPLSTGTFKPTSHCGVARTPVFPAPGPLTTYANPGPAQGGTASFASTFNGSSPIGTWSLYVIDTAPDDGGSIPGGWSLDVNPDVTPLPAAKPTPTPAPGPKPAKKKCKKGKKGAAAAKKKGCKKKKKKK